MQLSAEKIEQIVSQKIFELTYKKILSPDEELVESGILTSITLAELAVALEREFTISISFMEINKDNFKSVNAIKNLIIKK
jgi:acyl carrier protein